MNITTKTRKLRLTDSGFYTVRPASLSKDELCDMCGHKPFCSMRENISRFAQVRASVDECSSFSPPLIFQDLINLDKPRVNTIRLGLSWAKRLAPKHSVAIAKSGGEIVAYARVKEIHFGSKEEVLTKHAEFNHTVIHKAIPNHAEELETIMKKIYGPRIYAGTESLTAIYLELESDSL